MVFTRLWAFAKGLKGETLSVGIFKILFVVAVPVALIVIGVIIYLVVGGSSKK